jgi:hypothetical protein
MSRSLFFVAGLLAGVPVTLAASQVGALNVFSNGTVADADPINQNFDDLKVAINDIENRVRSLEAFNPTSLNSIDDAGASCAAILAAGDAAGNGAYWLDVDGDGGVAPFLAHCDMVTDGGGWTLVAAFAGMPDYAMFNFSGGRNVDEVVNSSLTPRVAGSGEGTGPAHYSAAIIDALFDDGSQQYLSLTGASVGGYILSRHTKNTPDATFDGFRGIYHTSYTAASGFSAVTVQASFNGNPLPVASPSWTSRTVTGRSCAAPPGGIGCYHYLPDDITGGGQWTFRENLDNTPNESYGGVENVPNLVFVR